MADKDVSVCKNWSSPEAFGYTVHLSEDPVHGLLFMRFQQLV